MEEKKKGFFRRLAEGLSKTRDNIVSGFDSIFTGYSTIDDDFYEELEETLVMGDIGINATTSIIENLKAKVEEQNIKDPGECRQLLIQSIKDQMATKDADYAFEHRHDRKRKGILAAADTFRAAATEQLTEWAARSGVDIITGAEGSDPGAVVFDAIQAAKARDADVLIVDTAGRLHNKKNLMNELGKINRIIEREYPEAYRETLVVLDGTTGQNALAQAREFEEATDITGIILTKLDGTAKGGIAVAIQSELGVPVKYIGVGEQIDDLQKFDPNAFVNALFNIEEEEPEYHMYWPD